MAGCERNGAPTLKVCVTLPFVGSTCKTSPGPARRLCPALPTRHLWRAYSVTLAKDFKAKPPARPSSTSPVAGNLRQARRLPSQRSETDQPSWLPERSSRAADERDGCGSPPVPPPGRPQAAVNSLVRKTKTEDENGENGPGRRRGCPRRLPQIRTCPSKPFRYKGEPGGTCRIGSPKRRQGA
jgi:hypothetical protein